MQPLDAMASNIYRNHWEMDNYGHKSHCCVECKGNIRVFEIALETIFISTPCGVCCKYTKLLAITSSESLLNMFSGDNTHRQLLVFTVYPTRTSIAITWIVYLGPLNQLLTYRPMAILPFSSEGFTVDLLGLLKDFLTLDLLVSAVGPLLDPCSVTFLAL